MNPRRKPRRPAIRESADDAKRPRVAAEPGDFDSTPAWSFALCDIDGPFGWRAASQSDLLRVFRHLGLLEKSKLSEIFGERHRKNHQPRPDQLGKTARDRLQALKLDPERLLSLRLTRAERIWLVREGTTLALLWWDPHHLVWPRKRR